ncbi:RNA splicing factor [Lithospermum erythrorhizon]|uniref:RNA splicing factor n=1 Tax=Lithospermum erythrorhizon TaxID=34254 RepID=A0AAV3PJ34_LITER
MAKPLFIRGLRRLSFLSLLNSSSSTTLSSLSSSIRSVDHNPLSISPSTRSPEVISFKNETNASFDNVRNFSSHGSVSFVISPEGKPKFETQETEPPKKEKWLTKKRLKIKRKKEKKKRKDANKRDPRRLSVKSKRKQKFPSAEERIKDKLERAKMKEASLLERLKRYEVPQVQGPIVKPHELTGEERFYIKKTAQKKSNYVPVGRRGIFGGVILNMHLHWKKHETVKVICKPCKPGQLQEYANDIARLSGGIPIQLIGKDTIVFYRGKDYEQPEIMSPIDTLSKKKALEKSKYEQSLESVKRFIEIAEKELELYYRHVALYGDPNDRNPHAILEQSTGSRARKRLKHSSSADERSQLLPSTENTALTCQDASEVYCDENENHL